MSGLTPQEQILRIWERGRRLSAVGPGDVRAHWDRAEHLASAVDPPPTSALDLGSGAGIPGLALAALWPDSRWTLVEASARRVRLLRAAVDELGWGHRVEIAHGRAEVLARLLAHREQYDLATARLFAPPGVTAECAAGFVRPGGLVVVAEPPAGEEAAERWPAEGLARLGLVARGRWGGAQHLERVGSLPDSVPRRDGVPGRRPLF